MEESALFMSALEDEVQALKKKQESENPYRSPSDSEGEEVEEEKGTEEVKMEVETGTAEQRQAEKEEEEERRAAKSEDEDYHSEDEDLVVEVGGSAGVLSSQPVVEDLTPAVAAAAEPAKTTTFSFQPEEEEEEEEEKKREYPDPAWSSSEAVESNEAKVKEEEWETYGSTVIAVREPRMEKAKKLQKDFTTYLIETRTLLEEYGGTEFSVRRRFSDFVKLRDLLLEAFPFLSLPALPEKTNSFDTAGLEKEPEYVEMRRRVLERFLGKLFVSPRDTSTANFSMRKEMTCHPVLVEFLTIPYDDFHTSKMKHGAKSAVSSMKKFFSKMGDGAKSIVSKMEGKQFLDDDGPAFRSAVAYAKKLAQGFNTLSSMSEVVANEYQDTADLLQYLGGELAALKATEMSLASDMKVATEEEDGTGSQKNKATLQEISSSIALFCEGLEGMKDRLLANGKLALRIAVSEDIEFGERMKEHEGDANGLARIAKNREPAVVAYNAAWNTLEKLKSKGEATDEMQKKIEDAVREKEEVRKKKQEITQVATGEIAHFRTRLASQLKGELKTHVQRQADLHARAKAMWMKMLSDLEAL
mmetsp:Transcript_34223/g.88398  ORF Transcript_34223/g.88398 Transcript_34223/m.88398 type:complete len:586 (-) Transcript_34223:460-2217(-)